MDRMLARIFQDGMLVQAGIPFCVFGRAEPGARVTAEAVGRELRRTETVCDDTGGFCAELEGISASFDRYELTLRCGERTERIEDVLFGELFLTAGQSNMELSVGYLDAREQLLAHSEDDGIRLLRLPNAFPSPRGPAFDERPFEPQEEIAEGMRWGKACAETVSDFSAIGFLAATTLKASLGVPVGVVDVSVGGALLLSFLPPAFVGRDPVLASYFREQGFSHERESYNRAGDKNFTQLCGIYNEKLHPLRRLKFRAMCWYQGESEVLGTGLPLYDRALELLVEAMRGTFGTLPFFAFEISPLVYAQRLGAVRLNEKIARVCARLPDCWTVPQYDVFPEYLVPDGKLEYHPLHPVAKRPLAERLARLLSANLFEGRSLRAPAVLRTESAGGSTRVWFDTCSPLRCRGGKLLGFYVCDREGTFFPARARIVGTDCVLLRHPSVSRPAWVGYASFLYGGIGNLTDAEGIPALPFRTKECEEEYRPLIPFLCGADETVSNAFYPENGGLLRKPAWKNGELFSSAAAKVRVADGEPRLRFARDNAAFFFCGLSPELGAAWQAAELERYDALKLYFRASAEIRFYGLHVLTAEGEVLSCRPAACETDQTYALLPAGRSEAAVDLTRAYDCFFSPVPREKLAHVRALQFAFRAFEAGTVRFVSIEYVKKR